MPGLVEGVSPDGAGGIWALSLRESGWLSHIDASGSIRNYRIPSAKPGVSSVAVAKDGTVYFTEQFASKIGILRSDGTINEYATPTTTRPVDLVPGPGKMWFSEDPGEGSNKSAIGEIFPNGRIVEHAILEPAPQPAAGPEELQDDGAGGVWFVGTRDNLFCQPKPCPRFIGHLEKGGTVIRRPIPRNGYAFSALADSDGLWFEDLNGGGGGGGQVDVDLMTPGGRVVQYPGQNTMFTDTPIGRMGGMVWVATTVPLEIFTVTPSSRTPYVLPTLPGAGMDDMLVHPTTSDGYIWLVDSPNILNNPTGTYAYRFDPRTNETETIQITNAFTCLLGLRPSPTVSGDVLWAADTCSPGHIWAVRF